MATACAPLPTQQEKLMLDVIEFLLSAVKGNPDFMESLGEYDPTPLFKIEMAKRLVRTDGKKSFPAATDQILKFFNNALIVQTNKGEVDLNKVIKGMLEILGLDTTEFPPIIA